MSTLDKLLKEKYNIAESESNQAARCLVDLFRIFYHVDARQKQETLIKDKRRKINVSNYDENKRGSN